MKKRLLILITAVTLIIAQQALPAFAGENNYTQVLFPIEDQWSEGQITTEKGLNSGTENSDYYYYELYPEQIVGADHYSLGGLPFDLSMLYPEIELDNEEFLEEDELKAPPGDGDPISGVPGSPAPLNDGLIFLLVFSFLFISYKLLKNTHTMKASSSQAKREISRSTMEFSTSLRPQSGKQSSKKNRKYRIASSFLITMILLLCTSNLQAQTLRAKPENKFITNDKNYKWSTADGGTDAYTGATIHVLKNDELGVCTEETIEITITKAPTKGTAVVVANNNTPGLIKNRILYKANHDGKKNFTVCGQDILRYRIKCGSSTSSEVEVLINISDQPDNIVWEGCFMDPKPITWGMKDHRSTNINHSPFQTPIVGDIDDDGIVEILVATDPVEGLKSVSGISYSVYRPASKISIYKGNNITTPHLTFTTTRPFSWTSFTKYNLVKTKINNKITGIIVVQEADYRLRAYDTKGNWIWTSDEAYYSNRNYYSYGFTGMYLAELNHDDIPEILICGRIFDSSTGKRLAYNNAESIDPMIAADIFHDGEPRCIIANKIYKVEKDASNNITGIALEKTITPPRITKVDPDYSGNGFNTMARGRALVADLDNDGKLELIVSASTSNRDADGGVHMSSVVVIYVADPETGEIKATKYIPNASSSSYPFIGDIDGDGKVEILLVKSVGLGAGADKNNFMYAFKYNPSDANKLLSQFWRISHDDGSGMTGISLFDFDQDGQAELVYRDEKRLRIIDGSLKNSTVPVDKAEFENLSLTQNEIPVIADIDNDGQAEILIVGGRSDVAGSSNTKGPLWVYKSSDPTNSPWAWARPVWNQHWYNPVYVNEDLTLNTHPMNPATVFIDKDGAEHRPYNNFFQQATLLDNQGKMFRYGPDLTYDSSKGNGTGVVYTTSGTSLNVTIYVLNQGDADFASPLYVSAYKMSAGSYTRITYQGFAISIPKGETKTISFSIPLSSLIGLFNPHVEIQLRLNEVSGSIPYGAPECLYYNNYYPSSFYGAPPAAACEGEQVTLQMYPQDNSFQYRWYATASSSSQVLSSTYSCTVTKNASQQQKLYVDVYQGSTKMNKDGRYQVNLFLPPKELVWTGGGYNSNWHNYSNWNEPAGITPTELRIPRKCTNVLIPDGVNYYPNLSKTTYTTYKTPQCADIRFEFGGEVARTDMLDYDRAFVQYNVGYYKDGQTALAVKQGFVTNKGGSSYTPSHMVRDRYYALSAPLNKIATGDFSLGGKPSTWQQAFVPTQTSSSTWVGEFKAPANTNDIELNEDLGYAIALWVAGDNDGEMGEDRDLHNGYQTGLDGLEGIIEMPYFENDAASNLHRLHEYDKTNKISKFGYYYYQQPNFPQASKTPGSITRADEAYRFIFDKQVTDGKFTITVPAVSEIMIGNPTMSTMNFDAFYTANSSNIENYYRLFENQVFKTYTPSGSPAKTTPIAPMQAFFIKTKGTAGSTVDLVYPFATASVTRTTSASHGLRSAEEEDFYPPIQINASQGDYTSQISLVLNEPERKNIEQLFYRYADNTPQLYLKDEAGKRNAVQFEGRSGKEIPLGIQFEKEAIVTLSFNDTEDLPLESLSLVDTKTGTETDLLKTGSYTFVHDADGERFILRVGRLRNTTGIDELDSESTVNVYPEGNRIVVSSDQAITAIEVYDTQGRLIIQQTTTDGLFINDSGIYIVRVTLANGERKAVKVTL